MGRKKSVDYSPEEFQELSREERQIRGRMSTLNRMIKRREEQIEELMKPVLEKESEIKTIREELNGLKEQISKIGFEFPSFRIESYITKGKSYYRGVWYVNSKKFQYYIGSEKIVQKVVSEKYPGILVKNELDKVLDCYLKDLQMSYWNNQYNSKKSE
jgi:seryl-tRNA synthetase